LIIMSLDLVLACEERIVNAWPSVDTLIAEGCVLRFAHGYSGRANSLSALRPETRLTSDFMDWCEAQYRQAGLPPRVRVTPLLVPEMLAMLEARGYRPESHAIGMIAPVTAPSLPDPDLVMAPAATTQWVRGICARQSGSKKDADMALHAIVSRIRLPAIFATLLQEEHEIGFGMCALERGMAEIGAIMIDESARGRGMAKRLVSGLMGWATQAGASQAYLQVEPDNAPAVQLYQGLGFAEVYRYSTLVLAP
jgi:N-acetylglutamate synthase